MGAVRGYRAAEAQFDPKVNKNLARQGGKLLLG
jgi:hypothetical protein